MAGFVDPEELVAAGALEIEGDRAALARFTDLFEMDFGPGGPPAEALPPAMRGE